VPENPPWLFGSGKSATPCVRMHCENLTSLARYWGDTELLPAPPRRRLEHAFIAFWYAAEFGLIPLDGGIEYPPPLFWSGKFGSP
jgi:hypothetical protein